MAIIKSSGRPSSGYKNTAGTKVPGVTTIIGRFKDSGALMFWAFEQGKLAEQGKISSLYDNRDKAADAGSLAHDLIEAAIHGANTDALVLQATACLDPDVREKAWNALGQFQAWYRQTGIKILETERPLVSEKWGFGGTFDAIGEIDGKIVLVDWKTSNGVYTDYLIQLAAYKVLIEECTDYRIDGGFHLLRFSKEEADFSHHYWGELDDGWAAFALYLEAYRLDKKLKARVK